MIEAVTHGRVLLVRLDRPEQRNALDTDHCEQVVRVLDEAASGARCVVVTGEGSAFCSGADLNQVYAGDFLTALYRMLRRITEHPAPVIAAVNGPAIGAGTQLALACDLRVASDGAVFGVPAARLGVAVDPWTIRRLALLAGGGPARRVLLGCENLSAGDAYARGLVDRLGDLDAALAWAAEIADLAPLTLTYTKAAANALLETGPDPETDKRLADLFQACWTSEDLAEGRRARAEKRPPRFEGR